jgi:hypothetical protein
MEGSLVLWQEFYVAKDPWMRTLPKREIKNKINK